MRFIPPPQSPAVFATGTHDLQVVWTSAASRVAVEIGGTRVEHNGGSEPGALDVGGLDPDTEIDVEIDLDGVLTRRRARTLAAPPGPEVDRFATMNDLHLGLHTFGLTDRIRDRHATQITSLTCALAAVDEASRWGARTLLLKGDLVHKGRPAEWDMLEQVVNATSVTTRATLGNHEAAGGRDERSRAHLEQLGLAVEPVQVIERPGIRVLVIDTTTADSHRGRVDHVHHAIVDIVDDGRPTLVLHHHQMHALPVPTTYPKGILGAPVRRLLSAVAARNPNVVFAAGHTHRHRRHVRYGLTMAELGSTKDYPGTWCGYVVHEGGLVQTVRRVADPAALAWTERTGAAVGGVWSRWSPGSLSDRCFSVEWR